MKTALVFFLLLDVACAFAATVAALGAPNQEAFERNGNIAAWVLLTCFQLGVVLIQCKDREAE